jgi:hypothetical protein
MAARCTQAKPMSNCQLSIEDVDYHVASFGMDVYPPIEVQAERTRLNMFYEAARERWSALYEQLTVGNDDFKISKHFRKQPEVAGPALPLDTFILTSRGPVFRFPLRLPSPVEGETGLAGQFLECFSEVRTMFLSALPGRAVLRIGLVREVVFLTGDTNYSGIVSKQSEWSGARLVGGSRLHLYRDDKCNVRLEISPCEIRQATQLPIGTRLEQRKGFGLQIKLDINNAEIRPMNETAIEEVVTRANGFWPDRILEYLKSEEL